MQKRILCLLISLVLLFSASPSIGATESKADQLEIMYETLLSLGIMQRTNKEEYDFLDEVSKSTFINYVCNIVDEFGYGETNQQDAIDLAESMKLIDADQDDLYKEIPYQEALTILVRLLRLEDYAQRNGGYPQGYIAAAHRMGLTDDVAHNRMEAPINRGTVTQLLYNTLYAEIENESSILYEYKRIYRVNGIVDGTDATSFVETNQMMNGGISIEGTIYKTETDFSHLLGMKVEAFVKDRKDVKDEVVYLRPYGNKELVIDGEDVVGANANCTELTYYNGDNDRRASISVTADVIYNGQVKADYTSADFKPEDGMVRLIDNGGSADYDVVLITNYKTVVVDYKQSLEFAIKNKYSKDTTIATLSLKMENDDVLSVKKGGIDIGYDGIQVGDVLKVAESEVNGKRVVAILVSSETVEGAVSTRKADDYGNTVVVVDGREYVFSKAFAKAIAAGEDEAKDPAIGKSYLFYLDSDGRIAFVGEQKDAERYAMVYAVGKDEGFTDTYHLRLFTQKGEWVEYPVADKITFDGVKGLKPEETQLVSFPCGINGDVNVIAYKLNSNGEIISIDLPEPDDGEGNDGAFNTSGNTAADKARQTVADLSYFGAQMVLHSTGENKQYYMSNTSKLWYFSDMTRISDEESYVLGQKSDLLADSDYKVIAYNVDEFGFSDLYVVVEGSAYRRRKEADFLLVDSIGKTLKTDGDAEEVVFGRMGSYDSISYGTKDPAYIAGLSKGDIIQVITDANGRITEAPTIVHSVGDTDTLCPTGNYMRSYDAVIKGTVEKNDCTGYRMKIDCGSAGEIAIKTNNNTVVFIYDTAKGTTTRATIGDVEIGRYAVIKINGYLARTIVIYK